MIEVRKSLELAEEAAKQSQIDSQAKIDAEKSKLEEAEAKFNMQLVSLTENLSYNKTDLTATQEKLMDVVKHNDELRGFNLGMVLHIIHIIFVVSATSLHIVIISGDSKKTHRLLKS